MKAFWGLVLILFGVSYLGAGLGWWGYQIPNSLWQFWPLILVFWGLDLLAKRTSFYTPLMIIAVIISGAFVYLSLYTQSNNLDSPLNYRTMEPTTSNITAQMPTESKSSKVTIETGAIDFRIEGETDKLLSGDLVSNFASSDLTTGTEESVATAKLSTVGGEGMGRGRWMMRGDWRNELNLALNSKLPLDLSVHSGAAKLNFDLKKYRLSAFVLNSGASSINLHFGDLIQDKARLDIETGASSIEIDFPNSVGVVITAETGLTSQDFVGYTQKDGKWYSRDYESKAKKIELYIKAGASSLKVS